MRATKFNIALVVDRFAATASACFYGLGVLLLVRKTVPLPPAFSAFRLTAVTLLVLVAWTLLDLSRRRWFDPDYAAAWLDLHNHGGGAIMSEFPGAPAVKIVPGLSLRFFFRRLAWPALFLAVAVLIPAPNRVEGLSGASLDRQVSRVEAEVEEVAAAGLAAVPEVEELRQRLEQVREIAAENPEAAAEALASLEPRLEEARTALLADAASAVEAVARLSGAAAAGDGLDGTAEYREAELERLRHTLAGLPAEAGGAGREALNEVRETLAAEASSMAAAGGPGASSGRRGELSSEHLDSLARTLRDFGRAVAGSERALAGRGGRSAARDGALTRLENATSALDRPAGAEAGRDGDAPGRGGVSRGRSDAPLVLGDEAAGDGLGTEYRPLAGSALPPEPGMILSRDRALPGEALEPEAIREPRRSAADAPRSVRAGMSGDAAGPSRERAVRRYYQQLEETDE